MPELPEVEVLRRSLEKPLVGDQFEKVRIHFPTLREPLCGPALRALEGRTIERLRRRAKYLWLDVSGGRTLAVHLGMSGRLTLVPRGASLAPHEHLSFALESGRRLRFCDPRRFGMALVVPTDDLAADRHFRHLGLEPLEADFDGKALRALARGRRVPVKTFLMDATRVVGVGNIYAAEALFRGGIHPRRSVARIAQRRFDLLAESVRDVLAEAIAQGGTTLNDFADGDGNAGWFQVSLAVYGREGEPCMNGCGSVIRRVNLSNRSTYWCPRCQR